MSNLPTEPMTIRRLAVDNFMRIRVADVRPSPTGLILVRGRNASGKSSLIKSMSSILRGRRRSQELPIRDGEHGADVVLDLGDLVIREHWTRDSGGEAKSKLSVTAKDGSEIKSPRAILDALTGYFADPVAFLEMSSADQVKTTLAVLGLGGKLSVLEEEALEIFERRTTAGREAKRLAGARTSMEAELATLPPAYEGKPLEDLVTELKSSREQNEKLTAAEVDKRYATNRWREATKEIARLEAALVHQREVLDAAVRSGKIAAEALDAAEVLDLEPLYTEIKACERAAKYSGRHEQMCEIAIQAEAALQVHTASDEELKAKRAEITALLAGAKFPMDGVTYDPDDKTLKVGGIPFAQASQAERIKLAAAVAMAGTPLIKVMFAREGSLLDHESQAQLAEIAEASGFQLWLEVVDTDPVGSGVWIEDGEAFESTPAITLAEEIEAATDRLN